MDGTIPSRAGIRWLTPVLALALLGTTASGRAQDAAQLSPEAATAEATAEADADFDAAFEIIDEPVEPELPDHAVDITTIEPAEPEASQLGRGMASYYGRRFHGRPTANGERFDMHAMTAAHRTLPFGSMVRVTNTRNGQSVVVRINDRGPFIRGRTIDLSRGAAEQIGMVSAGHASVELELLES
ncbi:septal ring lytic transglycosylase RlpA family protein [Aurantiacibacter gangjinensis]|uniref:Endolytic peptidoglycan transglycosylase RlpA n=2 Tax=Aurantiacibacter gangjinensis TaxID=502682 RepID=A0A0G9MSM8_9SPHN|nr:septal ring lytic transglycosylase RlpA family protein [Aurantiacibacter gangjinensis]KLE33574.1 hypothetical protein AAW01_00615 [Aurantiacibacter gangjinensis]